MEEREYEVLYQVEQKHFWYQALHKQIVDTLNELFPQRSEIRILDAGCGTGFLLQKMQTNNFAAGIDLSEHALEFCARRKLNNIARATVLELPFGSETFNAVVSADVLYHRNVPEDRRALLEFYRVLKPGGTLIVNLPAFEFLRSAHDSAIHTQRRYKKKQIEILMRSCGLKIDRLYYRNCLLFPLIAFLRILRKKNWKSGRIPESDVVLPPKFVNRSLARILFADDWLVKRIPFPAGISLFCVAFK
ncbi:class I SAM-dependent methyltransferase [bacterium]|nr:class I SAM-dependent methyltransferase [bacterium]